MKRPAGPRRECNRRRLHGWHGWAGGLGHSGATPARSRHRPGPPPLVDDRPSAGDIPPAANRTRALKRVGGLQKPRRPSRGFRSSAGNAAAGTGSLLPRCVPTSRPAGSNTSRRQPRIRTLTTTRRPTCRISSATPRACVKIRSSRHGDTCKLRLKTRSIQPAEKPLSETENFHRKQPLNRLQSQRHTPLANTSTSSCAHNLFPKCRFARRTPDRFEAPHTSPHHILQTHPDPAASHRAIRIPGGPPPALAAFTPCRGIRGVASRKNFA